jgi:hypothetical protein
MADGKQTVPFRTKMFDGVGNMVRTWILFFEEFIAGASSLSHAGAIPMVGTPGTLAESAIADDGTTVTVTGRALNVTGNVVATGDVSGGATSLAALLALTVSLQSQINTLNSGKANHGGALTGTANLTTGAVTGTVT